MWWGGGGSDPEPVEEVMCSSSVFWKLMLLKNLCYNFSCLYAFWSIGHTLKTEARVLVHSPLADTL